MKRSQGGVRAAALVSNSDLAATSQGEVDGWQDRCGSRNLAANPASEQVWQAVTFSIRCLSTKHLRSPIASIGIRPWVVGFIIGIPPALQGTDVIFSKSCPTFRLPTAPQQVLYRVVDPMPWYPAKIQCTLFALARTNVGPPNTWQSSNFCSEQVSQTEATDYV